MKTQRIVVVIVSLCAVATCGMSGFLWWKLGDVERSADAAILERDGYVREMLQKSTQIAELSMSIGRAADQTKADLEEERAGRAADAKRYAEQMAVEQRRGSAAQAEVVKLTGLLADARDREPEVDLGPEEHSRFTRTWTLADGAPVEATFVSYERGTIKMITEVDGVKHDAEFKMTDLSPADREWIKEETKARHAEEDSLAARKATGPELTRCPNKNCKRGTLYGPVSGGTSFINGGRVNSVSVLGLGPIGACPVCAGRGVVERK